MDDFLKKNPLEGKESNVPTKKIEFKSFKDKKAYRTYVYNLDGYINDPVKLNAILRELKKSLGTSCVFKETEFGYGHGFGGDFSEKIKNYLISNGYVTKDAF